MHMLLLFSLMFSLCLTSLLTLLWTLYHNIYKSTREKQSPYECGFDPAGSARTPFSLRFFLLAVVFLIFDIEIILLMILPMNPLTLSPSTFLYPTMTFLAAIMLGTIHELKEGTLDWTE